MYYYRIRLFFLPRNITTTSKSGARTDTCDCCCCLLLFTLFSILLARTTSGRLWSWCSGLTFLSTYWCKVVRSLRPLCLAGSFRLLLLLLLPLLMLLFLFLLSSLALSRTVASLLCFSRALTARRCHLGLFLLPLRGASSYYSTSLFHLLNHSLFAAATSAVSYT